MAVEVNYHIHRVAALHDMDFPIFHNKNKRRSVIFCLVPDGKCTTVCHRRCVGSVERQNYTYGHQPHPEQPERGSPTGSVGPKNRPLATGSRRPTTEESLGEKRRSSRLS